MNIGELLESAVTNACWWTVSAIVRLPDSRVLRWRLSKLMLGAGMLRHLAILHAQAPGIRPPVPGAPPGVTAFVNVGVVPMDTNRALLNQTVLVQGGRIAALGPKRQVQIPTGATRIDGRGKYLIPGLVDCHAHLGAITLGLMGMAPAKQGEPWKTLSAPFYPAVLGEALAEFRLAELLANGVTTIRNMDWNEYGAHTGEEQGTWKLSGEQALQLRARAAAGEIWSPRIYTAGKWVRGPILEFNGKAGAGIGSPEPAIDSIPAYVAAYKAAGYDYIKVHNEPLDVFVAVLAAARQIGIPVVGHAEGEKLEQALAGGMRSIEHLTGYPELSLAWTHGRSIDTAAYRAQVAAVVAATKQAGTWNCVAVSGSTHPGVIRALQDAGAGILSGSDVDGAGLMGDMARLVDTRELTPYEALAAATRNFAVYAQTLDETGTIAVGKRADLVLLNGNPLQDINQVKRPAGVMLGGRWRDRSALDTAVRAARQKALYGFYIQQAASVRGPYWDGKGLWPDSLEQAYTAQRATLVDSLLASPDSLTGQARLLALLTRQLGEVRTTLSEEQRGVFDPRARKWLTELDADGYHLAIPGVTR